MEEQKKTCPYCGEEVENGAQKCRYCGEWLVEHDDSQTHKVETVQPTTPPNGGNDYVDERPKLKWNIIIPIACLVLGLIVIGIESSKHESADKHYENIDTMAVDSLGDVVDTLAVDTVPIYSEDDYYPEVSDEDYDEDNTASRSYSRRKDPIGEHYLNGLINNKHKIYMELDFEDNGEVSGAYSYNKGNGSLSVIGEYNNGSLELYEYNDAGDQTGYFIGRVDPEEKTYSGTFTNYKDQSMPFHLYFE